MEMSFLRQEILREDALKPLFLSLGRIHEYARGFLSMTSVQARMAAVTTQLPGVQKLSAGNEIPASCHTACVSVTDNLLHTEDCADPSRILLHI